MELVDKYLTKHDKKVRDRFQQESKSDKLQATKIFSFFQNAFNQQQFRFQLNGVDFFKEEDNGPLMQKLIESYYRISQGDESKKFYMYRIQFEFGQIREIISFWLQREPQLKIVYIQQGGSAVGRGTVGIASDQGKSKNQNQLEISKNDSGLLEDNDEFEINGQKIASMMEDSRKRIREEQSKLEKATDEQERMKIKNRIKDLSMKMKILEQQSKTNGDKQTKKYEDIKTNKIGQRDNSSQNVDFASISKKVKINYKAIFDFYAKQTHLTGVKATFERIEQQSQTINYQKLVHFLREFDLLPESVPERKKVHGLYIKFCEASRVLSLQGFLSVLDGVVNILCPKKTNQERSQILKQKIYMKNSKNNKILNHPFHSLEKQDFRINVNELTYSFKIKPQDGKFIHEVNNSIEKRRKEKEEAKNDRLKEREIVKIRYLKKLQSIDPFNPLLAKNKSILEVKPQQQDPVASFDNMQRYRDASFNFQGHFGIDLSHQIFDNPVKSSRRVASEVKRESSQRYSKGQEVQKRVEKLERYETAKMESLMSGIIERTNAKIQKFGGSPQKIQKSVRFADQ